MQPPTSVLLPARHSSICLLRQCNAHSHHFLVTLHKHAEEDAQSNRLANPPDLTTTNSRRGLEILSNTLSLCLSTHPSLIQTDLEAGKTRLTKNPERSAMCSLMPWISGARWVEQDCSSWISETLLPLMERRRWLPISGKEREIVFSTIGGEIN